MNRYCLSVIYVSVVVIWAIRWVLIGLSEPKVNLNAITKSPQKKFHFNDTYTEIKKQAVIEVHEPVQKFVLHTVTYASHRGRDDRFCRAVESALRNEHKIVILGWGLPWLGLSQKIKNAYEYASKLEEDELFLFTDAFDVLFTRNASYITSKFLDKNCKILFSAECGCWPHVMENLEICLTKYPASPTPYRYLNSGTWIGRAGISSKMLKVVMDAAGNNFANANDQKLLADMYISKQFDISLDYYNTIFQSMHMTLDPPLPYCNPMKDISLLPQQGYWYNKRTDSIPAVFHFNGGGKIHHLSMESQMWYKKSLHNTKSLRNKIRNMKLIIPTSPSGNLSFYEICPEYCDSFLKIV